MSELELFTEPMPAPDPLPRNQVAVMRLLLRNLPQGITAAEAGAAVHAVRGKHTADETCVFCAKDGAKVLRALARKGLATGRRDGWWTPPGPKAKRAHEVARLEQERAEAPLSPSAQARSCSGPVDDHGFPKGF